MKANELRIGNYIANGVEGIFKSDIMSIGKVLEIGNEGRKFEQIYCECEESLEWFFKDLYCGIPITEKWLLNFGFEQYGQKNEANPMVLNSRDFDFAIYPPSDFYKKQYWHTGIIESINSHKTLNIKYIHQLQNLYFALTGEELIIKQ